MPRLGLLTDSRRIDAKERIPRLLRNRVPVEGQSLRLPRSKFSLTLKGDEERFKDAVRRTVESLRQHPLVGARYRLSAPPLHNLGSWPVAGFEAIRIYYLLDSEAIHVIRVLHGKRDLKRILERERTV